MRFQLRKKHKHGGRKLKYMFEQQQKGWLKTCNANEYVW